MRRSGFTIAEALIGLGLMVLLISSAVYVLAFGGRTTGRLTPQMAAQQQTRKAVVRFIRELQEGMEVIRPQPGSTLPFAVITDKVGAIRWFFLVQSKTNPKLADLYRYRRDTAVPPAQRTELILNNVSRLAFTSQSEGAVSINLAVMEETAEYAVLTSVRLRNLAAAEELW